MSLYPHVDSLFGGSVAKELVLEIEDPRLFEDNPDLMLPRGVVDPCWEKPAVPEV